MNRKIAGRALFYLASDVISRALPFAVFPYVAKKLGAAEFGEFSIFLVFVNVATIFVGFSAHNSVVVSFFRRDRDWIKLGSELLSVWSFACILLILLMVPLLGNVLVGQVASAIACALGAWIFQFAVSIAQFHEQSFRYGVLQVVRSILIASAQFAPVYFSLHTSHSLVASYVIAHALLAMICLKMILGYGLSVGFVNIRSADLSWAHKFSFPLTINGLSGWLRASFDRLILSSLLGLKAVGIYSFGFQTGSIIGVVGLSFSRVSSFYVMSALSSGAESKSQIRRHLLRVLLMFFCANSILFAMYLVAVKIFFSFYVGLEYSNALPVAVLIGVGFYLQSIASLLSPILQFFSKTSSIGWLAVALSVVSVLFIFIFVNWLGFIGAAYSFALVWIVHFSVMVWFCVRAFNEWCGPAMSTDSGVANG